MCQKKKNSKYLVLVLGMNLGATFLERFFGENIVKELKRSRLDALSCCFGILLQNEVSIIDSGLIVTCLSNHTIEVQILIESHIGEPTFIPRIILQPTTKVSVKFFRQHFCEIGFYYENQQISRSIC